MLTAWCGLLALIGFFAYARSLGNGTLAMEYRYRLYALRDRLRMRLIDGQIGKRSWAFDYLDSSLSVVIDKLSALSMYRAVLAAVMYHSDPRVAALRANLEIAFNQYPALRETYSEYGDLLLEYFAHRHALTVGLLAQAAKSVRSLARVYLQAKQLLLDLRVTPDGSDFSLAKT